MPDDPYRYRSRTHRLGHHVGCIARGCGVIAAEPAGGSDDVVDGTFQRVQVGADPRPLGRVVERLGVDAQGGQRGTQAMGEATACYRRAVELFGHLGDRYHQAVALANLGDSHDAAGHGDRARNAWQQAARILDELDHPDARLWAPLRLPDRPAA